MTETMKDAGARKKLGALGVAATGAAQVIEQLGKTIKYAGAEAKRGVGVGMSQGLTPSETATMTRNTLTRKQVATYKRKDRIGSQGFVERQRQPNVRKGPTPAQALEEELYLAFFKDHTSCNSGAKTSLRTLRLQMHEYMETLYAAYPSRLRGLIAANPDLVSQCLAKRTKSRFDKSLLSAHAREIIALRKGAQLDETSEYGDRLQRAKEEYAERIAFQCCGRMPSTKSPSGGQQLVNLPSADDHRQDVVLEMGGQQLVNLPSTDDHRQNAVLEMGGQQLMNSPSTDDHRQDAVLETCGGEFELDKFADYDPTPMQQEAMFKFLERKKQRFTTKVHSKECPIHDKGPVFEQRLIMVTKALAANAETRDAISMSIKQLNVVKEQVDGNESGVVDAKRTELLRLNAALVECDRLAVELTASKRVCDRKMREFMLHKEQFATAREKVQEIEGRLQVGECLVYRDFVNQYTTDGKLMNLVLVLRWKEEGDHDLNTLKIHNLCTDKETNGATSYFVADVFEHHLKRKDAIFRKFHTLYISGDHGPHFSSVRTVYNESTWFAKYGIKVHCYFLCSYHAYNRCDGAGVEAKRIAQAWAKKQKEQTEATVIADIINNCAHSNSVAVPFPCINMSADVFPAKLLKSTKEDTLNFTKKCEFCYYYNDEKGREVREPGIIRCRLVSGKDAEPYKVFDLLAPSKLRPNMCSVCSNALQRPIRHGDTRCPRQIQPSRGKKEFLANKMRAKVDPVRMTGIQLTKSLKKAKNKVCTLDSIPLFRMLVFHLPMI